MYKRLSIENSRGIKKFSLEDFKQVNLIYGKNNTCKTTILESLYMLSSPSKSDNPLRINAKRGINAINSDIWKSFFYKHDISKSIKISSDFYNKEQREIEITIKKNPNLRDNFEGLNIKAFEVKEDNNPKVINIGITTSKGNIEYINSREYIKEIHKTWVNHYLGLEDILNEININLSTLIVKKKLDYIVNILKNIEPDLLQILLVPPKFIYVDTGFDSLQPLNSLGSSFTHALHIISSFFISTDGVIFIDDLESNLNSTSLSLIYNILLKLSKELNVQVFITTNTLESVKLFVDTCIKNVPNTTDEIKLYKLERDRKDNSLKYTDYDRKKIELSLSEIKR